MTATANEVIEQLRSIENPANVAGMARFGIRGEKVLGISVNTLREMAKGTGRDHRLAGELWESGIHEARMLATLVEDPKQVDEAQMERWAADFDSWDLCDGACFNLFDKTPYAWDKAMEWSGREEEFVKRAGFVLMAGLAVHDKKADDRRFEPFLPVITREATDGRNFVRKAVNWALRGIGKRSRYLNGLAVDTARRIQQIDDKTARWIAADALRELTGEKTLARIKR